MLINPNNIADDRIFDCLQENHTKTVLRINNVTRDLFATANLLV